MEGYIYLKYTIEMPYSHSDSRLHTGGAGENAAGFSPTCVHVVGVLPISSKPELQM